MLRKYTPAEDLFLIEHIGKMTQKEMAICLSRSPESILERIQVLEKQGKLKRLGQVRDGKLNRYYSKKEDEFIKKHYPTHKANFLVQKLNRPLSSIQYRVARLKVEKKKENPSPYLNVRQIAELLRVCRRVVLEWIYLGFLKAIGSDATNDSYSGWHIKPEDFYDFVKNHYYLYDPDRIKDKFLRSIVDATPAAKAIPACQAVKILGVGRAAISKYARRGKFPVSYKGFGPGGHVRWYVQLDGSAFEWFRDLVGDINHIDQAAEWVMKAMETRNPILNILVKYEPERVKEVRKRIQTRPVANRIATKFEETTPEGEKFKNLLNNKSPGFS